MEKKVVGVLVGVNEAGAGGLTLHVAHRHADMRNAQEDQPRRQGRSWTPEKHRKAYVILRCGGAVRCTGSAADGDRYLPFWRHFFC
eukprot:4835-Pleurochrysis_carterae.AAC.2